jgi:hypothetical protein
VADISDRTTRLQSLIDRLWAWQEAACQELFLGLSERALQRRWRSARLRLHRAFRGDPPA